MAETRRLWFSYIRFAFMSAGFRQLRDRSIGDVVEVSRDLRGRLPADLIVATYRSSTRRCAALALADDVSTSAVDALLDPVVKTLPLTMPGVLYIAMQDEGALR